MMQLAARPWFIAGFLVLLAGGYLMGSSRCTKARAELVGAVAASTRKLTTISGQIEKSAAIDLRMREVQDRTLGGTLETVDSRLRARLHRIGEELQIRGLTVSTGPTYQHRSPAHSRYAERELRDEIDFVELRGSIIGEGTLGQALQLLHRVQAEPWLKRVTEFRLEPKDNGERLGVTLRLATIYLPGREPQSKEWPAYDSGSFAAYTALAAANPFRVPPPDAPVVPTTTIVAASAAFAYGQWALTIVAHDSAGPEVWLLNRQSGESRRLVIGDRLAEAQLVAAEGDEARFQLGAEQFAILVGQTLDDRSPLKQ